MECVTSSEELEESDSIVNDDQSDEIDATYWHYRKNALVHFGLLSFTLPEFINFMQMLIQTVDITLDYLLNEKTANWERLCTNLINAHCHTHDDRNESGHATACDNRKKKQNINNQFFESITMASKIKTYYRFKELNNNAKTKAVADLFYDIAVNKVNVSEMIRDYKKREKHVETKKHQHLMDKFRYFSEESSEDEESLENEEMSDVEPLKEMQKEIVDSDDDACIGDLAQVEVNSDCDVRDSVNVHQVLSSMFVSSTNDKNVYEHQ